LFEESDCYFDSYLAGDGSNSGLLKSCDVRASRRSTDTGRTLSKTTVSHGDYLLVTDILFDTQVSKTYDCGKLSFDLALLASYSSGEV
jgi:hypothetical protein